jgi:hypothetical protein
LSETSDITIKEPTDEEIKAWWNWASQFSMTSTPFAREWAKEGRDYNVKGQPVNVHVFCLSCTAGAGGTDVVTRPLKAALASGMDLLIPVFVAASEISFDAAEELLGEAPKVRFFINEVEARPIKKQTSVGPIVFVENNSFEEEPGTKESYYSTGYWAKVSPEGIRSLRFGGEGGQTYQQNAQGEKIIGGQFDTEVTYDIETQV